MRGTGCCLLVIGAVGFVCLLSPASSRASEPLPVAQTIEVGDRACLFLDDHFLATQSGFTRIWHQGQPRPEVALKENAPWERWLHAFGSAFHDPKTGRYRMYYESAIYPSRTPGRSFTTYICYAESKDGKAWDRPRLGLIADQGSKDNNIVFSLAENANAWIDPLDPDPAGRLKMWLYGGREGFGQTLYRSGDGLHWEPAGSGPAPVYADPAEGKFSDTNQVGYDPRGRRYLAAIRTFPLYDVAENKDKRRRAIGISVSKDLHKGWSPIVTVLKPDEADDARLARLSRHAEKPAVPEM